MSVALLDKSRKINKLIHNSTYEGFNIQSILEIFESQILSDLFLINLTGRVVSEYKSAAVNRLFELTRVKTGDYFDEKVLKNLQMVSITKENVRPEILGFEVPSFDTFFMVVPVEAFSQSYGYLVMYRTQSPYDIDDIVLSEYVANIIAMCWAENDNKAILKSKESKSYARQIISSFSESELKAAVYILNELDGISGTIKILEVSEQISVTRSVIVNAIKKLDASGVISSKSCGPKGTFIQINNDIVYKELVSLNEIVG